MRNRSQENSPEAGSTRLEDRIIEGQTFPQVVVELADEDQSIVDHYPDQGDDPQHGEDVNRKAMDPMPP